MNLLSNDVSLILSRIVEVYIQYIHFKFVFILTQVNRFEMATFFINALWIAPLLTFIVGCLMWRMVGPVGLVGIFVVFMIAPMLSKFSSFSHFSITHTPFSIKKGYAGKLTSKFRLQTAIRTDERIRFMDEIISGVLVIKLYGWELPFEKLIAYARMMELNVIRKTSYLRAIHMTSILFTTRFALFCTMVAMALIDGPDSITSDRIFVISALFSIVSHLMSQRFARSIGETAEVLVALKRIESFLRLDEKNSDFNSKVGNGMENGKTVNQVSKYILFFCGLEEHPTLKNIQLIDRKRNLIQ